MNPAPPRISIFCCLGLSVLLLAGCGRLEPIRSYQVPKRVEPVSRKVQEVDRMLAAYIVEEATNQAWFFKVAGPKEAVADIETDFRGVLESVRFNDAGTPKWTTPEGWGERFDNTAMRTATLTAAGDVPLEVAISRLTYDAEAPYDFTLKNINRWRGQVQLAPIGYGELEQQLERFFVDGKEAVLVDLVGELQNTGPPFASMMNRGNADLPDPIETPHPVASDTPAGPERSGQSPNLPVQGPAPPPGSTAGRTAIGPAPPPVGPAPPGSSASGPAPPAASGPKYELPYGWQVAPNDSFSRLAFAVSEGDQSARITVSAVGGGTEGNIVRWRGQIGLGPPTPDELESSVSSIEIDGVEADYVRLAGPADAARRRESILAVVAEIDGIPWIVRLRGDWKLAEQERERFEAFVKSLRFE